MCVQRTTSSHRSLSRGACPPWQQRVTSAAWTECGDRPSAERSSTFDHVKLWSPTIASTQSWPAQSSFAFGDIYSRKSLTQQEQTLVTISTLVALGTEPQKSGRYAALETISGVGGDGRIGIGSSGPRDSRAVPLACRDPWIGCSRETGRSRLSPVDSAGCARSHIRGQCEPRVPRAISKRWQDGVARLVDGEPIHGILTEARRVGADVIVMGWRGHGAVTPAAHRQCVPRCGSPRVVLGAGRPATASRTPPRHRCIRWLATRGTRAGVPGCARTEARHSRHSIQSSRYDACPSAGADHSGYASECGGGSGADQQRERRNKARKELSRAARALSAGGWRVDEVVTGGDSASGSPRDGSKNARRPCGGGRQGRHGASSSPARECRGRDTQSQSCSSARSPLTRRSVRSDRFQVSRRSAHRSRARSQGCRRPRHCRTRQKRGPRSRAFTSTQLSTLVICGS